MDIGKNRFANGCRGANICQKICWLSHEFLNRSTIFCDTVEPSFRFICVLPRSQKCSVPRWRTDGRTIKGFRAQPPGKPVRMRIKMAAEVQTFVKEYVDFLMSLWRLVRINLQTAAEVRTFVQKYVNFLTSFWTGREFSAILLNRVFVLYVFYHVLRNAPHPPDRRTDRQTDN